MFLFVSIRQILHWFICLTLKHNERLKKVPQRKCLSDLFSPPQQHPLPLHRHPFLLIVSPLPPLASSACFPWAPQEAHHSQPFKERGR